jgi:hypothetical protein
MSFEGLEDHLPKYLSSADQAELVSHLRDFENRNYYTTLFPTDLLQGDGWFGFDIINLMDGKRDKIKGIMVSNSCDIDPSHKRDLPTRIVFAPLVKMGAYADLLARANLDPRQIETKIEAIRKQRVTSLFFLPKGGLLDEDHIALLDDLHNVPLKMFDEFEARSKLFTLSQVGFYLFVFKLSIHFCRFSENLSRSA